MSADKILSIQKIFWCSTKWKICQILTTPMRKLHPKKFLPNMSAYVICVSFLSVSSRCWVFWRSCELSTDKSSWTIFKTLYFLCSAVKHQNNIWIESISSADIVGINYPTCYVAQAIVILHPKKCLNNLGYKICL